MIALTSLYIFRFASIVSHLANGPSLSVFPGNLLKWLSESMANCFHQTSAINPMTNHAPKHPPPPKNLPSRKRRKIFGIGLHQMLGYFEILLLFGIWINKTESTNQNVPTQATSACVISRTHTQPHDVKRYFGHLSKDLIQCLQWRRGLSHHVALLLLATLLSATQLL